MRKLSIAVLLVLNTSALAGGKVNVPAGDSALDLTGSPDTAAIIITKTRVICLDGAPFIPVVRGGWDAGASQGCQVQIYSDSSGNIQFVGPVVNATASVGQLVVNPDAGGNGTLDVTGAATFQNTVTLALLKSNANLPITFSFGGTGCSTTCDGGLVAGSTAVDGTISIVSGATGSTSTVVATITLVDGGVGFPAFTNKPKCVLSAGNAAAAVIPIADAIWINSTLTPAQTITLNSSATGLPAGNYLFNYHCAD